MWTVQNRHGWGWNVFDPAGRPGAIESLSTAEGAEVYCEQRNAGKTHREAWAAAKATGAMTRDEYDRAERQQRKGPHFAMGLF